MQPSSTLSGDNSRSTERRSARRELVKCAILSYFDQNNWGQILDLSEKGMLVVCGHLPTIYRRINFSFQGMGSAPAQVRNKTIKLVTGEIRWTREFERLAGVEFVDLAEENRQQIRQWLSIGEDGGFLSEEEEGFDEEPAPVDAIAPPACDSETSSEGKGDAPAETLPLAEPVSTEASQLRPLLYEDVPEAPDFAKDSSVADERKLTTHHKVYKPAPGFPKRRIVLILLSGLLGLPVVIMGVRNFVMWRERPTGEQIQRPVAEASRLSGVALAAGAGRPFVVEVVDVNNHRWMLPFTENGTKSPKHEEFSKPKQTTARREASAGPGTATKTASERKEARKFGLTAPKINPAKSDSAPTGIPAAPVLDSKIAALEGPMDSILPDPLTPVAASRPPVVGGEVQQAHLIRSVPAQYPVMARSRGIAGDVVMDALIDKTGNVKDVKVVSGPMELQNAAEEALRKWKYQPARLDGQPVAMHLSVTMKFHIP